MSPTRENTPPLHVMKFLILEFVTLSLLASSNGNTTCPANCSIGDTELGVRCKHDIFEKHAPVHIAQQSSAHDFNDTFQAMIIAITKNKYNASDVCYHNKYFLECDVISQTCKCASTGIWGDFRYVQRGNDCFISEKGRCNPDRSSTLLCLPGTKCTKTGDVYSSSKMKYICSSGSISSLLLLPQLQELTLWLIFVGVALLWSE